MGLNVLGFTCSAISFAANFCAAVFRGTAKHPCTSTLVVGNAMHSVCRSVHFTSGAILSS